MQARRSVAAVIMGLTLVAGMGAVDGASATPVHTKDGKECPVGEVKKVWYGGTSKKCPNLPDELDHLFYTSQFTTALAHKYRERTAFIQLRLKDLGFTPIGIDGLYGNQTKSVVKRYQKKKHLTVDGKVGLQTWKSLFGLGKA